VKGGFGDPAITDNPPTGVIFQPTSPVDVLFTCTADLDCSVLRLEILFIFNILEW
jgi:hypothetical protein